MLPSLVAAVVCLHTVSCGIDSLVYLNASPILVSADDKNIVFRMPTATSETGSYLGVELYYRIYATIEAAEADKATISSVQAAEDYFPGSEVKSHLLNISSIDYSKLALDRIISVPAIPEETAPAGALISLEFPSTLSAAPAVIIRDATTRNVLDTFIMSRSILVSGTNNYASFFTEPARTDADFDYSSTDTDPGTYYLQFFAAAYGMDFASFEELYGRALYLGRIVLDLFE